MLQNKGTLSEKVFEERNLIRIENEIGLSPWWPAPIFLVMFWGPVSIWGFQDGDIGLGLTFGIISLVTLTFMFSTNEKKVFGNQISKKIELSWRDGKTMNWSFSLELEKEYDAFQEDQKNKPVLLNEREDRPIKYWYYRDYVWKENEDYTANELKVLVDQKLLQKEKRIAKAEKEVNAKKVNENKIEINLENKTVSLNGEKISSKNNWIGPDLTESGPDVNEDWYLEYNGPAPPVEGIYGENYGVDRGDGTIPIEFYIEKWGIPADFGQTDYEKSFMEKEKISEPQIDLSKSNSKKTQTEIVTDVLSSMDLASIKQVAKITKLPEPTIRRILGQGAKSGDFRRVSAGVYSITEAKTAVQQEGSLEEIKNKEIFERKIWDERNLSGQRKKTLKFIIENPNKTPEEIEKATKVNISIIYSIAQVEEVEIKLPSYLDEKYRKYKQDRQIISDELEKNPQISLTEISRKTNIPKTAVYYTVRKYKLEFKKEKAKSRKPIKEKNSRTRKNFDFIEEYLEVLNNRSSELHGEKLITEIQVRNLKELVECDGVVAMAARELNYNRSKTLRDSLKLISSKNNELKDIIASIKNREILEEHYDLPKSLIETLPKLVKNVIENKAVKVWDERNLKGKRAEILNYIQENPGKNLKEIATNCDTSSYAIIHSIAQMEDVNVKLSKETDYKFKKYKKERDLVIECFEDNPNFTVSEINAKTRIDMSTIYNIGKRHKLEFRKTAHIVNQKAKERAKIVEDYVIKNPNKAIEEIANSLDLKYSHVSEDIRKLRLNNYIKRKIPNKIKERKLEHAVIETSEYDDLDLGIIWTPKYALVESISNQIENLGEALVGVSFPVDSEMLTMPCPCFVNQKEKGVMLRFTIEEIIRFGRPNLPVEKELLLSDFEDKQFVTFFRLSSAIILNQPLSLGDFTKINGQSVKSARNYTIIKDSTNHII